MSKRTERDGEPVPTAKMVRDLVREKTGKTPGEDSVKAGKTTGKHVDKILERVKKDRLGQEDMRDLIRKLEDLIKSEAQRDSTE